MVTTCNTELLPDTVIKSSHTPGQAVIWQSPGSRFEVIRQSPNCQGTVVDLSFIAPAFSSFFIVCQIIYISFLPH